MKRKYHIGHVAAAGIVGTLVGLSTGLPITISPETSRQTVVEGNREEPNQRYRVLTSGGGFTVSEFDGKYEITSPWTYGGFEDMTDEGKDGFLENPTGREWNRHQRMYDEIFDKLREQKIRGSHRDVVVNSD